MHNVMAGNKPKPIAHSAPRREPSWYGILKISENYLFAGFALIVFFPAMLVISVLVKLDSRGPVFVRQRCRAANGKIVGVLKFRTAAVPQNDESIVSSCRRENRVTQAGRILHRTGLDELPMLLNVLAGDMPLAGPGRCRSLRARRRGKRSNIKQPIRYGPA